MGLSYWNQWDQSEIMSMYGIEENYDADLEHDEVDTKLSQRCDCSRCMDCLGLSWKDFI